MTSFADAFFKTQREAVEEVARRRASTGKQGMVAHIEPSPYGKGFRVRSIPVEFVFEPMIDNLALGIRPSSPYPSLRKRAGRKFG